MSSFCRRYAKSVIFLMFFEDCVGFCDFMPKINLIFACVQLRIIYYLGTEFVFDACSGLQGGHLGPPLQAFVILCRIIRMCKRQIKGRHRADPYIYSISFIDTDVFPATSLKIAYIMFSPCASFNCHSTLGLNCCHSISRVPSFTSA